MGSVWLARNQTLDADVCIKLIRRDLATSRASQRLLREARAAAQLSHPCIVRVFDFGVTEYRDPFIVMELLRGDSLRQVLERKRRLPPTVAVATLLPVASALVEAHGKGVIHRDLKPENIMLVESDSGSVLPKVVDFGLAKLREEDGTRQLTQHKAVMGSPDYMSPEQARGEVTIDQRVDVWAFAAMLYEAITGMLPFSGENYNALLYAIRHNDPMPTTDLGLGNKDLWQILSRGLAKPVEDRWPDMRSFGAALARWAVNSDIEVDITGASIAVGWLSTPRRPFAQTPAGVPLVDPAAEIETLSPEDLVATTSEPPPPPARAVPPPPPVRGRPPVRAAAPPAPAGRPKMWVALAALPVVGLLMAGAWALNRTPSTAAPPVPAASTASAASAAPPPPTSAPAPTATPLAPPSASAAPAVATAGDPVACVAPLFPEHTFNDTSSTDLGFLCEMTDPRQAAPRLGRELVHSRGDSITDGMKEWPSLGWYQMAVVAIARARCCPDAAPLVLPSNGGTCPPLEKALDDLGRAAARGDDAAKELGQVDDVILCLVRNGGTAQYPYPVLARLDAPRSVFERTLGRAKRAASGH